MTNEDMPWVIGLTDEEIQELRTKKQELTEYGKQKIRELMRNQEPYPDAMFEEASRRELANKTIAELTTDEKIKLALEELAAIVMGGQDGEEYYNSIKFIKDVLESLK